MQIGMKVLEAFEKIHSAGYSYNNLKLENVMIGNPEGTLDDGREIRLVDF